MTMTDITAETGPRARSLDLLGLRQAGLGTLEGALATATVFLAPANYFKLQGIYVTAADMTAILCAVLILAQGNARLRFFGPATSFWMVSVLLLLTGLVIGSAFNGEPGALLTVILQYGFSLVVLPLILAGRSRRQTVALIRVFVLSVTLIMIHGAWLIHVTHSTNPRFVSITGRLRSLVERENEAAAIAAMAVSFAIALLVSRDMTRLGVVLTVPFLIYGIMLTGSNTGLVLALLGIAGFVVLVGSGRAILVTVLILGAAIVLIVTTGGELLPDAFRHRVLSAFLEGDITQAGSFSGRLDLIKESLAIARETWLVGLGADQYRVVSEMRAPVHNAYLLLLTEGGILSLLGTTGLLLTGVYLAWASRQFGRSNETSALTLAIVFIFATMLMMVPHFYARFWNVPLILALSLAASGIQTRRIELTDMQPSRNGAKAFVGFVSRQLK